MYAIEKQTVYYNPFHSFYFQISDVPPERASRAETGGIDKGRQQREKLGTSQTAQAEAVPHHLPDPHGQLKCRDC